MTRVKDSYKRKQPAMRVQARIHSWVFLLFLPSEAKKELLEWPLRLEDQEPEASRKVPWGALIGDGQQFWLYTLSLAEGKRCESLMTSSLQWLSSLRNSYMQTWALSALGEKNNIYPRKIRENKQNPCTAKRAVWPNTWQLE